MMMMLPPDEDTYRISCCKRGDAAATIGHKDNISWVAAATETQKHVKKAHHKKYLAVRMAPNLHIPALFGVRAIIGTPKAITMKKLFIFCRRQ
eukprot:scaffold5591_cov70-Skeletonema_dohrnii-CCMP3373.AAC.14